MIFIFFFSSRRRHTRFDCDWSSDVCSSDLFWERLDGAQSDDVIPKGREAFLNVPLQIVGEMKAEMPRHVQLLVWVPYRLCEFHSQPPLRLLASDFSFAYASSEMLRYRAASLSSSDRL